MGPVVVSTNSEIISAIGIIISIVGIVVVIRRNSKTDFDAFKKDVNDKLSIQTADILRLKTQMEPFWRIVEDSVLKSVTHNPLTLEERQALDRYHKKRYDPQYPNTPLEVEDLLQGKIGLQRELKMLEDNPNASTESTIPYILTIAAIDKRLAEKGYVLE